MLNFLPSIDKQHLYTFFNRKGVKRTEYFYILHIVDRFKLSLPIMAFVYLIEKKEQLSLPFMHEGFSYVF